MVATSEHPPKLLRQWARDAAHSRPPQAGGAARQDSWVANALLMVVLLELFLLGSGRLLQVGPVTVRMLLYVVAVIYAIAYLANRGRADREILGLGLAFLVLHLFSALVGIVNGARLDWLAEDLKPLSFFPTLFFFAVAIRDSDQIQRVSTLVKFAGAFLAVGYLVLLVVIFGGLIPFDILYLAFSRTGEFFFRGESAFVYKGFLYLGVGFFFLILDPRRSRKLLALLVLAALVLTFTRGLLLATVVVSLAGVMIVQRKQYTVFLSPLLVTAGFAAILPWFAAGRLGTTGGDALRLFDLRYVLDHVTWWSVLIGHGFGTGVGDRLRIEATYLELLHKQGVLGLAFWGAIFAFTVRDLLRAMRNGHEAAALPFFLASLFVMIESATNPFLTNPIGMSMVLVSLVSLRVLARAPSPAASALLQILPPRWSTPSPARQRLAAG